MKKAIIAMSGGVDSSVAALLTMKTGDDCIGATMQLFHNEDIGISKENCSGQYSFCAACCRACDSKRGRDGPH